MPRHNGAPRSNLHSHRSVEVEFGARHPMEYTEELDEFFSYVHTALGQAIPNKIEISEKQSIGRRLFRVYDDPQRLGISVIERRLSRQQAQRSGVRWSRADAGRIRQEIQNEIGRLELAERPLIMTFTNVARVGDFDDVGKARKLALLPDPESREAEFLVAEHEIAMSGMRGYLKAFRHPYTTYLPHWTVTRIHKEAGHAGLSRGVAALQALLPHTVELQPVKFFAPEQEI